MPQKNTKKTKVAINGFGRIGRAVFKIAFDKPDIEIVAINDLTDNKTLAHLLNYDSVYGVYHKKAKSTAKELIVANKKIPCFTEKDPQNLPWKDLGVDVVLECTGHFVKDGAFKTHLDAGAKKVVLSAPSKGKPEAPTYLIGVNDNKYKGEKVVSNASCTTNSIAPIAKIIDGKYKINQAYLTTIHSYTSSQNLVDSPHKDLRRSRAAAQNIIPTTTGATIAVTKIIKKLAGKFNGQAIRVPTLCGSISDLTFWVNKKTSAEGVNKQLKKSSQLKQYKNILEYSEEPLVSSDIIGNSHSSIIDSLSTQVMGDKLIKVMAWYDNEWGYSNRMLDMIRMVGKK